MSDPTIQANQRDFRCVHCNGKIMIPRELPPTTGPCPHCGGIITSPALQVDLPPAPAFTQQVSTEPQRPAPLPISMPSPAAPITPPAPLPIPAVEPQPEIPVAVLAPAPAPILPAAHPREPLVADEPPPVPRKAQGNLIPPQAPLSGQTAAPLHPPREEGKKSPAILIVTLLLLLIALGAAAAYFVKKELTKTPAQLPLVVPQEKKATPLTEAQYLRIGWQKDARETLEKFLAATDAEGKLPYIINGSEMGAEVKSFYGGTQINDTDTPAETFSAFELSDEDKKRGIFMMSYDQPPQFAMKEFFRPLAPLEVQYQLEEADLLLTTVALVGNFAMEPLRVHAFFKRGPDGLKLDWETFVQTKYRTFENFVSLPEQGLKKVFRVLILEDVPERGRDEPGTRTYRLIDPANKGDTQRVSVKVDSEIGHILSPINWRGSAETRPNTKTATVELAWTGDANNPTLEISRFLCWEFLGLGGDATAAVTAPK